MLGFRKLFYSDKYGFCLKNPLAFRDSNKPKIETCWGQYDRASEKPNPSKMLGDQNRDLVSPVSGFRKLVLFFSCLYFLTACYFGGSNTSNLSLFSSLPSVGAFSAPSDSEYFYIDLDRSKYESSQKIAPFYEISTTETFGDAETRDSPSNCEILLYLPEDEDDIQRIPSEEALICILDVLEYDLMIKDLHIVYNFPEDMCDSIRVSLPWHFNYEMQAGPEVTQSDAETRYCHWSENCRTNSSDTYEEVCTKDGNDGGEKYCNWNACDSEDNYVQCNNKDTPPAQIYCHWTEDCQTPAPDATLPNDSVSCTNNGETKHCTIAECEAEANKPNVQCEKAGETCDSEGNCAENEEDLCPNVNQFEGGQEVNCCSGGSKSDGTPWAPDRACYGGPAIIAEGDHQLPLSRSLVFESPSRGVKKTITLPSLINVNGGFRVNGIGISTPHANYIEELDVPVSDLTDINRNRDLPPFLRDCADCKNNSRPRHFFEFECLDSAGEMLHSIFLMIREWNTFQEFRDFYDEGGNDDSDPDVEGTEGEDCEYESQLNIDEDSYQCNDLLDLKDIRTCTSRDYGICPGSSYPEAQYSPLQL